MSLGWVIIWVLFLIYVSFRASQYYAKKRFGIAIALTFLALFVAYEVIMQWNGRSMVVPPQTPAGQTQPQENTPATPDGQPRPPYHPNMGPPPEATPEMSRQDSSEALTESSAEETSESPAPNQP